MVQLLFLWAWVAGCEPIPPTNLHDVTFAEDARLDTNGPIRLTAEPSAENPTIHVRVPDGREVYSGPLSIPALRPLELRVPLGTQGLWVRQDGAADPLWVVIVDGVARIDLGGAS